MAYTVKAHDERYFAAFERGTMEEALAKANELVAAGYNAVTIQDTDGYLYFESDFALLGESPSTKQQPGRFDTLLQVRDFHGNERRR
jgi:hypothetical protein